MNKQRRASLRSASAHLSMAVDIIRDVRYEEQDAMDNIPENLQSSERYETMEEAVDHLDDALDAIREAESELSHVLT